MSNTTKTIRINGKSYSEEDLSEAARAQVINLRVTDSEIERMKATLAIYQTARVAYAQALQKELGLVADTVAVNPGSEAAEPRRH
jgi:hypothetical protein